MPLTSVLVDVPVADLAYLIAISGCDTAAGTPVLGKRETTIWARVCELLTRHVLSGVNTGGNQNIDQERVL